MRLIAKMVKMRAEYPDIHYHLFNGNGDDVIGRLDKGLLDFGLLIEPAGIQKYDYIKLPTSDTWRLLMRKDSPLAGLKSIKPENLSGIFPCFIHSRPC